MIYTADIYKPTRKCEIQMKKSNGCEGGKEIRGTEISAIAASDGVRAQN